MSTEQEKSAVAHILADAQYPCIVELGAHCGEDETWLRDACSSDPLYVMVEPDPRNVQYLIELPRSENRRILIGAVSDQNEMRPFHFSENSLDHNHASGSLRYPSAHLECFPHVTFPCTGMVRCYTLDAIFERERLTKIDLLWVDIQGAEREMILGGAKALSHTRYLFMEAEPAVELYEGAALRAELLALLPGWSLLGEFEANVLLQNENFRDRGPRLT